MKKIKFKIYPDETFDEQGEKHNAYLKAGYRLISQSKTSDGSIKREYEKKVKK